MEVEPLVPFPYAIIAALALGGLQLYAMKITKDGFEKRKKENGVTAEDEKKHKFIMKLFPFWAIYVVFFVYIAFSGLGMYWANKI